MESPNIHSTQLYFMLSFMMIFQVMIVYLAMPKRWQISLCKFFKRVANNGKK